LFLNVTIAEQGNQIKSQIGYFGHDLYGIDFVHWRGGCWTNSGMEVVVVVYVTSLSFSQWCVIVQRCGSRSIVH
jgi:hypothetical protein